MWFKTCLAGVLGLGVIWASPGMAVTYNFSMIFDGSEVRLAPGSDNPHLKQLVPNDVAFIQIKASGSGYWQVDSDLVNAQYPMTFRTQFGGVRTSDILTDWKRDGVTVAEQDRIDALQRNFHIGGQAWNLAAGTAFDEVLITLKLNASSNTTTLVANGPDVFDDFGDTLFFRSGPENGVIAYFAGPPAPIPLPSSLPFLATGLAGLLVLAWMKRAPKPGKSSDKNST